MAPSMSVLTSFDYIENEIQSNPVNTDIEGAIESVRIERVEFGENVRAFFPQGQRKLSGVMMRPCPY